MKNGTHANSAGGAAAARVNKQRESEMALEVLTAPFATISVAPIDAPMWPVYPPGWFQPETAPAAPSWSGLNIERRNRIPAPDLVHLPLAAVDRGAEPNHEREPFLYARHPAIPDGAVELLGWDPRAFGSNKERK